MRGVRCRGSRHSPSVDRRDPDALKAWTWSVPLGIVCLIAWCGAAAAMVGGAPPAAPEVARHVVLLVGSRGNSCTGTAIARDLVLTAAHCVLPGADYKRVEFDAARRPLLDIADDRAPSAVRPEDAAGASRHRRRGADEARRAAAGDVAPAPLAPPAARSRPANASWCRLRRVGARRRPQRRHAAHRDPRRHRPAGRRCSCA